MSRLQTASKLLLITIACVLISSPSVDAAPSIYGRKSVSSHHSTDYPNTLHHDAIDISGGSKNDIADFEDDEYFLDAEENPFDPDVDEYEDGLNTSTDDYDAGSQYPVTDNSETLHHDGGAFPNGLKGALSGDDKTPTEILANDLPMVDEQSIADSIDVSGLDPDTPQRDDYKSERMAEPETIGAFPHHPKTEGEQDLFDYADHQSTILSDDSDDDLSNGEGALHSWINTREDIEDIDATFSNNIEQNVPETVVQADIEPAGIVNPVEENLPRHHEALHVKHPILSPERYNRKQYEKSLSMISEEEEPVTEGEPFLYDTETVAADNDDEDVGNLDDLKPFTFQQQAREKAQGAFSRFKKKFVNPTKRSIKYGVAYTSLLLIEGTLFVKEKAALVAVTLQEKGEKGKLIACETYDKVHDVAIACSVLVMKGSKWIADKSEIAAVEVQKAIQRGKIVAGGVLKKGYVYMMEKGRWAKEKFVSGLSTMKEAAKKGVIFAGVQIHNGMLYLEEKRRIIYEPAYQGALLIVGTGLLAADGINAKFKEMNVAIYNGSKWVIDHSKKAAETAAEALREGVIVSGTKLSRALERLRSKHERNKSNMKEFGHRLRGYFSKKKENVIVGADDIVEIANDDEYDYDKVHF